ncbi:MAG: hypothetical protein RIF32_23700 [Leptospirales bacterium]
MKIYLPESAGRGRRFKRGARPSFRNAGRGALCVAAAFFSFSCGFFAQPRVSEAYLDEFMPESATECLVTWPIHAIALPITATIDQGARTFEATLPAGRDALDFFWLEISDDNVMLSRTIAVPKLLVTPGIFVGSYIARWFYPLDDDDRPFRDFASTPEISPPPEESESQREEFDPQGPGGPENSDRAPPKMKPTYTPPRESRSPTTESTESESVE